MVEAMNNANKRMHVHSSIDVVNAMMLLLKMEAERFDRQKQLAANSTSFLTPKGSFYDQMLSVTQRNRRKICLSR